jgi:lysophospholipase L1-like esterase
VLIVGDSVSLGAQAAIGGKLTYHGWHVTQISHESMHTYQANGIVDTNRAAIGEVAIVQLGTNDGMDPGLFQKWLDGLMEHLRDVRRVYWVNLRNFAPWVPAANAVIVDAQNRWPNLRVIDWSGVASPNPALVYGDGYHLNPAGQAAMANLLAITLDAYVTERLTPPTTAAPPPTQPSEVVRPSGLSQAHVPRHSNDDLPVLTLVLAAAISLLLCGAAAMFARWTGIRKSSPQLG